MIDCPPPAPGGPHDPDGLSPLNEPLDFTGERFVPELVREMRYEHWHRYAFALPWIEGREVLDCACGEGYGADLLARRASRVVGADLSEEAVDHARERYGRHRDNLDYVTADCTRLPMAADSFDVVVSYETLEHIHGQAAMLDEFRRVLRPDGMLVLSSPDKRTYSDERGYDNEFHVRELYRDELVALVQERFPAWRLFGQKLLFHSAIWSLDEAGSGLRSGTLDREQRYRESPVPVHDPLYFIMLCAGAARYLPADAATLDLFDDEVESVYEHYNAEIRHHIESGRVFEDMKARIRELERDRSLLARLGKWLSGKTGGRNGD